MLPNRNPQSYQTKSLTWWANERPEVEDLLQALLERRRSKPETLLKKTGKQPVYLVGIAFHDHGNAEDFHFGRLDKKEKSIKCALDLTRIAAHGRKQRLNCAMEESKKVSLDNFEDPSKLVLLKADEYRLVHDLVIAKLQ